MTNLPDRATHLTPAHHDQLSIHMAGLLNATVEEARRNPMDEADLQALAVYVLDAINNTFETGKRAHFAMAIRTAIQTAYQLGRRSRHPRQVK